MLKECRKGCSNLQRHAQPKKNILQKKGGHNISPNLRKRWRSFTSRR